MKRAEKVIVIGLDGATFDIIKPLILDGELPTLRRLMENGSFGNLNSVPNMNSAAAWPSFATGKNPGKHGIYWMPIPKENSYDIKFLNGNSCQAAPIWRILSQAGKKVGIINVLMTYPAEAVNGFILAGLDCPDTASPGFCYPPELRNEIIKSWNDYIIMSRAAVHAQEGNLDKSIEMLHKQTEKRLEVAKYLMRTRPWDFFMVVFTTTDMAQHIFWHLHDPSHPAHNAKLVAKYKDPIIDIYKKLDMCVDELIDEAGSETTIFVMSDHGAGINCEGTQFLNQWLESEGFLHYVKPSILGRPILGALNILLYLVNGLIKLIQIILSERQIRALRQKMPFLRARIANKIRASEIDWSRTQAYWDGSSNAMRINVRGRDPQGVVKCGKEYEDLRNLIIARLYQTQDVVTGRQLVDKVYKREDVYYGQYVERAPDLEIKWKTGGVVKGMVSNKQNNPQKKGRIEAFSTPSSHRMNGIVIMKGKYIKKGEEIKGAEIIDLAPSILYLMGQGIPADMDGKVLKEVIDPSFLKEHPIQYIEPLPQGVDKEKGGHYSEKEKKELEEKLRALGYIE